MNSAVVEFRTLARGDFPLLSSWLTDPLVARWWNHDPTLPAVERDFGPALDAADPTEMFLACAGGEPFGLIQRYPVAAYPDYVAELQAVCALPAAALSIDYLIGAAAYRGRGLGAAMISEFTTLTWTDHPHANSIIVPVPVGNVASWRALERAGYQRIATVALRPDNPIDAPEHHLYRRDRAA